LEREADARGASVRNFGLIWVSGRAAGPELAKTRLARELWERIGAAVPRVGFRGNGSLTVLRTPEELKVAEEVCARPDAAERAFTLLDADEARTLNPALRGPFLAAVHCGLDGAVESRRVPAALRAAMTGTGRYTWLPGREARALADGPAVVDHLGVR